MTKPLQLEGQRFGMLTVIKVAGQKRGRLTWLCRCDCGGTSTPTGVSLRSGRGVHSCGCVKGNRKHGYTGRREYVAYYAAKTRCQDTNHYCYKYYGGRGIKFLFTSFAQFLAEVGDRPTPRHSIDRINNDGNYEPGNIRWATYKEQIANQRPRRRTA